MKEKRSRVVFLAVIILACLFISACKTNGTVQLSAPTNVRVEGTTLKWNFVENAIGYTVKIVSGSGADINNDVGEEIPIDGMSTTSYSLAHLSSGNYTVSVKARGDSIVYSSSVYTGIQFERKVDIGDEYGDGTISRPFGEFDDINTKNSFLGYGLDIINASSISSKNILMTYPIFDMGLLENEMLLYSNEHFNSFVAIEGETIEEFIRSMSNSSSISAGASVSAKGNIYGVDASASVSMSGGISTNFTKTSSSVQSQYFLEIIAENQSYWLILQSGEDRYKEMLSEEFKKDLYSEMEPALLFEKYGTHLLTSVAMGGSISMYYTMYSYEESEMTSKFAEVSSKVKSEVSAAYGGYSGSVGSESSYETAFTYSKAASEYGIFIDERVFCAGGGSYGINNSTTLYDHYYDWQNSLDLYPVVIGIKDSNSLYPIWDLLDMNVEGAEERYNELYNYFLEYGLDSLNELYETYNITPAVAPNDIINIKLDGKDYSDGSFPQTKAGDTVKISFDVTPDNANKYKKLYTVYSDKDTDEFKAATIDETGVLTVSPNVKSGTYITVTISAGPVSEQVTFYVINSYNVNFITRVNGLEVAPLIGVSEGEYIEEPKVSRDGWILDGWFMDIEMTQPFDFEKDYINKHTTLYAKWTAIKPVVTFDTLGGSKIDPVTVAYMGCVASPNNPMKTGYTFGGWYIDEDFTIPYDFASVLVDDITLYAKWNRIEYLVSFEANGGTPVDSIVTSIENGYKVTEPITERALYNFKGWYSDKELTKPFYFGTEVIEDITLYAKWEEKVFTISYFVDGVAYGNAQSYTFGQVIEYLDDPINQGKEFSGWIWTEGDLPETMPAEDIVLEGTFDQTVFTVKYFIDGIHVDTASVYKGHAIPIKENLQCKEGYTFSGWSMKKDDEFVVIPSIMPSENIELYGLFDINEHTIIFNTNGGSSVSPITAHYGTAIIMPKDPVRTGYTFEGWDIEIPSEMPDEDIIANAKWKNKQYNITYDLNNNEIKGTYGVEGAVNKATYNVTSTVNIATSSYGKYYTFDGWYTEATGGIKIALPNGQLIKNISGYTDSEGQWIYTGNITLYAHWSKAYSGYDYVDNVDELIEKMISNGTILLLRDLDLGGMRWIPIESFSGFLNGDGHCLYHFYIDESGTGSANFGFIENNEGTVQNLTIGKADEKIYDSTYSVYYNINYIESNKQSSVYVGGIAGHNYGDGNIIGCKLVNVKISATLADNNNDKSAYLGVGGIIGGSYSNISMCTVENSMLDLNMTANKDSGDNNHGYVGGIVGFNLSGTVNECTSKYNILDLDIRGNGVDKDNKSKIYGRLGGIVGIQTEGGCTIACSVKENTHKHYMTDTKITIPDYQEGELVGKSENSTII